MHFKNRLYGRFYILSDYLVNSDINITNLIFKDMKILSANYDYMSREFEYCAWCKEFTIVPEGVIIPKYLIVIDTKNNTRTIEPLYKLKGDNINDRPRN